MFAARQGAQRRMVMQWRAGKRWRLKKVLRKTDDLCHCSNGSARTRASSSLSSPASSLASSSSGPSASSSAPSLESRHSSELLLADEIRGDFPLIKNSDVIYFDNAATSQKPVSVLETLTKYYEHDNSNVHRGVHSLSQRATDAYEGARAAVAEFINCRSPSESNSLPPLSTGSSSKANGCIVFTRGATEAINLVAYSWGMNSLTSGDEIVLSVAEHHSNIVPWQMVAKKTGAVLKFVRLNENEEIDLKDLREKVHKQTKLVALPHVSNVLGSVTDVHEVVSIAKQFNSKVLLDACQSVPHMKIDVRELDVDWLVASGHKMCAPTGIGFLYGKDEAMEAMEPFMGGGEMIQDVYLDHSTFAPPPSRFEAGTPAIGEAIGLGAACSYLMNIGMDRVHEYECMIGNYLYQRIQTIDGIRIIGPPPPSQAISASSVSSNRAALCSFVVDGVHATDVATVLDMNGVAIRSGHHCCQPLHRELGMNASARASLYLYNTVEEIDTFIESLKESIKFFVV